MGWLSRVFLGHVTTWLCVADLVVGRQLPAAAQKMKSNAESGPPRATDQMLGNQGWQQVKVTGDGIEVWKLLPPGSSYMAIMARAQLNASAQSLFEVLHSGDASIVKQYNPLVANHCDLEKQSEDAKISWTATRSVWPVKARDFVTRVTYTRRENGALAIYNEPATHPDRPEGGNGKYTRARIVHGLYVLQTLPDWHRQQTELLMLHHFDAGGDIPSWLVNQLATIKPAAFVRKLEKVASKLDRSGRGAGEEGPGQQRREPQPACAMLGRVDLRMPVWLQRCTGFSRV